MTPANEYVYTYTVDDIERIPDFQKDLSHWNVYFADSCGATG